MINNTTVTLAGKPIIANNTYFNFTSCRFKELYQDACDVTVEEKYIELRYNKGSKGCTVDLLSTNADNSNKIKFKTGVRGDAKGGLNRCLDVATFYDESYNNILPFVYSVSNAAIEKLNNHRFDPGEGCTAVCKNINGSCKTHTSLQVSWSGYDGKVYAHTYLSKRTFIFFLNHFIVGESKNQGLSRSKASVSENMTLDLEISTASGFTVEYAAREPFNASKEAVCVPESTPLFAPKAWTITDGEHKDKHLLVFSLLRQTAAYTYKGNSLAEPPNGPRCELFVQFHTDNYSLLLVDRFATTTPPTTTTTPATTGAPAAETSETPVTTTSSLPTSSATVDSFTSIRTTTQTTTKRPEQQECGGGLLAIGTAAAGLFVGIVIAVLVWLWMKNKAGRMRKREGSRTPNVQKKIVCLRCTRLRRRPKAKRLSGHSLHGKRIKELKTAVGLPSIEDELEAIWKRVEKKKAMDKMQYLVDQFEKRKDKELFERGYTPELKKKGLAAVGSFEEWKKNKNIAATFTLDDGTRTAIEYQQPKVIEKIVEVERVIIEKPDEWTIEENPTLEEQERLAEIKAANRGAVDGVEVPMSEEEQEVDERWIPPSEPNNNPSENSLL
uniref:Uncharacterized protein n=1 Tax=Meloidogyne enterolobii TaxID=390850 RepID=A0A6V7VFS1_MELEN|nr:unnamed protein product [Meloidogyne enterolobii]